MLSCPHTALLRHDEGRRSHGGFGSGRCDCGACEGVGSDAAGVCGGALVAAQAKLPEEAGHEALGLVPLLDDLVIDQHLQRRGGLQSIRARPELRLMP